VKYSLYDNAIFYINFNGVSYIFDNNAYIYIFLVKEEKMEMWIRSQDKESLVLVDKICCMENRIVFVPNNGHGRVTIGIYESKERALEVLDDINEVLNHKCIFNINKESWQAIFATYSLEEQNRILKNMSAYQMPKK
jgi:hypothetical protein